jgi:hypothetical protein
VPAGERPERRRVAPADTLPALRVDGDAIPLREGDGSEDGLLAAGGAYTVGITRRAGAPAEVRLAAHEHGRVVLRSGMLPAGVRVHRSDGRPVAHDRDGDTLVFKARAGEAYRIG